MGLKIGIGGKLGPLRGGISTRGVGVGLGPVSAGSGFGRRRGSSSSGGVGCLGGLLVLCMWLLIVAWPWFAATWLAVKAGAGRHSEARTLSGAIAEAAYVLIIVALLVTGSRKKSAPARQASGDTAAKLHNRITDLEAAAMNQLVVATRELSKVVQRDLGSQPINREAQADALAATRALEDAWRRFVPDEVGRLILSMQVTSSLDRMADAITAGDASARRRTTANRRATEECRRRLRLRYRMPRPLSGASSQRSQQAKSMRRAEHPTYADESKFPGATEPRVGAPAGAQKLRHAQRCVSNPNDGREHQSRPRSCCHFRARRAYLPREPGSLACSRECAAATATRIASGVVVLVQAWVPAAVLELAPARGAAVQVHGS